MPSRPSAEQLDKTQKFHLDRRLSRIEREVLVNYAEALDAIRADLAKLYERYSVAGELTHAEMSKYNRLRSLEKQLTEDLRPAFLKNERLIERMSQIEYEEAFYRFAYTIDQQAGVALRWGLLREADVVAAVANPLKKLALSGLKQDGLIAVRRAVTQGLIRGLSYPAMARTVRDAINTNAARATRIVRTEGQRAQVMGQQRTYDVARERGVEVVDVWDAALDDRTRDSHGALDGVAAKYRSGQPYWNTAVGEVRGPLQSGVASFDLNCRCRIRGEVKGYEPQVRRIRGEGVVPYQTFDQWAEAKGLTRNRYGELIGAARRAA